MTTAQMARRGVKRYAVAREVDERRLWLVFRGVYSTVHPSLLSLEARLAAAVLAGGPGARLCDLTAAAWLGLTPSMPSTIHIAVPHPRKPQAGIRWHRLTLRPEDTTTHRRFPTTSVQRTLLDIAAHRTQWDLRRAMAEAEYHYDVQAEDLKATLRKGHPGSDNLRRAIKRHIPQLARTRSELERTFLRFCEAYGLPIPDINHDLGGAAVDALFREAGVAVELDGVKGHTGERRVLRDHRRDLHRRADGLTPLRYHYAQLTEEPDLVAADLKRAGVPVLTQVLANGDVCKG